MEEKKFPEGFLWGASTSAYQVEGGIENTDWAEAAREGLVPPAGRASDFYHRFESDFEIARNLGMNAQRISIEWARIEPTEGKFDEQEIEHYRKVLKALKKRGMTPVVNLWHFTLPTWLSDRGGFLSYRAPGLFARYARYVVERLGEDADFWLTVNEPMVYAGAGYMKGVWPPFSRSIFSFLRVISAQARAHRLAYRAIKEARPDIKVGIAKHNIFFDADGNPLNHVLWALADWFWNHRFFSLIRGHQDFIGLNHYRHRRIGKYLPDEPQYSRSDMGWEIHPTSLYHCLLALKRYNLPIIISENGVADAEDSRRKAFIENAARCVLRAIAEGVPVVGYFHWSLLDNYEWADGFSKRFGLIEVDYDTLERKVRPSAKFYGEICTKNALPD
jgi:beta-glucosidase